MHPGEDGLHCPGLDASRETATWLWNHRFSLLFSDNIALEAMPVEEASSSTGASSPLMGMGIAELLTFEELFSRLRRRRGLRMHGNGQAG